MKALRFVVAVPIRPTEFWKLTSADRPDQVCSDHPTLWRSRDVPMIAFGKADIILGITFSKASAALLNRLPSDVPVGDGAVAKATWLVRNCWGGYIAFLHDHATDKLTAFVDPSGLCPVYRTETPTHVVLASDPDLIGTATRLPLAVSWPALHSHLYRPELRQRWTCIGGVTELAPGELIWLTAQTTTGERIWLPDDFMPNGTSVAMKEAAAELRAIAIPVVRAWATVMGPVAVAASGGVDSSFICAALKAGGESFTCVTVATADPSGDERAFVKMLSDHLGVQTISAIFDSELIDPLRSVSLGLARPTRKAFMAALDSALFDAGRGVGANVVFDGNGGDNLFCFLHSSAPVVDRLFSQGFGPGAWATCIDMCRVTGCDLPTMMRAIARRLRRHKRFADWPCDPLLLSRLPDDSEHIDPLTAWLDTSVGRHLGKRDHLALIMQAQHQIHGLGACGLPRFSPLMSQPLVEACLRIPTWAWCEGGINRALARAAFATELPREILARTSKSGPDSFILRSFDQHRSITRDLLMDGLLAQHGILDRAAVDEALKTDVISGGSVIYRLLDFAEAENWAQSW